VRLDNDLKISVFSEVYEPAEDSYLLICAVEGDFETLLDMGTGSGIVALHAAKSGALVTAADINPQAVANTRYNASNNNLDLRIVCSDLFSKITGRYDVITFNPPYLPSVHTSRPWDGGPGGVLIIRRFLSSAKNYMNPGGRIYMVISTRSELASVLKDFSSAYTFVEATSQSFFFERLLVYSITPKNYGDNPKKIHDPKNRSIRVL
jgi:release factor glutamine methyltransferase